MLYKKYARLPLVLDAISAAPAASSNVPDEKIAVIELKNNLPSPPAFAA